MTNPYDKPTKAGAYWFEGRVPGSGFMRDQYFDEPVKVWQMEYTNELYISPRGKVIYLHQCQGKWWPIEKPNE